MQYPSEKSVIQDMRKREAQNAEQLEHFNKDVNGITWFNSTASTPERLLAIEEAIREYGHLLPYGDTRGDEFARLIFKNQGGNALVHVLAALTNVDYHTS